MPKLSWYDLIELSGGEKALALDDSKLKRFDLGDIYAIINTTIKAYYFEAISAGTTTGQVSKPAGGRATFVMDEWGETTDAILSTIDGGRPTFKTPLDAAGHAVGTSFDSDGSFTFDGTPSPAVDIALIYCYTAKLSDYNSSETLFESEIIVWSSDGKAVRPLDMDQKPLVNPADPTDEHGIGDREYNDSRYVQNSLFGACTFLYAFENNSPTAQSPAQMLDILGLGNDDTPQFAGLDLGTGELTAGSISSGNNDLQIKNYGTVRLLVSGSNLIQKKVGGLGGAETVSPGSNSSSNLICGVAYADSGGAGKISIGNGSFGCHVFGMAYSQNAEDATIETGAGASGCIVAGTAWSSDRGGGPGGTWYPGQITTQDYAYGAFACGFAAGYTMEVGTSSFVAGQAILGDTKATGTPSFAFGDDVEVSANNAGIFGKMCNNVTASSFRFGWSANGGIHIQDHDMTLYDNDEAYEIHTGSTNGVVFGVSGDKLAFLGADPIAQVTTGVSAATFSIGGGGNVQTNDTFDGYTVAQVVKALRTYGLLA